MVQRLLLLVRSLNSQDFWLDRIDMDITKFVDEVIFNMVFGAGVFMALMIMGQLDSGYILLLYFMFKGLKDTYVSAP